MLDLPEKYPSNLVSLPLHQREAIEEDKKRWFKAVRLFNTGKTKKVVSFLNSLPLGEYQDDMRRRFNLLKDKKKLSRV